MSHEEKLWCRFTIYCALFWGAYLFFAASNLAGGDYFGPVWLSLPLAITALLVAIRCHKNRYQSRNHGS